jgi:hypothetical protein
MYFGVGKMHRSFASLRMTSERGQAAAFQITAHPYDALHWNHLRAQRLPRHGRSPYNLITSSSFQAAGRGDYAAWLHSALAICALL